MRTASRISAYRDAGYRHRGVDRCGTVFPGGELVIRTVITLLLVVVMPAWSGNGEPRQLCLSCHPVHYAERGGCSACHQGNPAAARKNIAHAGLRAGKYVRFTLGGQTLIHEAEQLMARLGCRRCHVSAGRGNQLATALDAVARRRGAAELAQSIRKPVVNMPDFSLAEEQITMLVNVIYAGATGNDTAESDSEVIHFSAAGKKNADTFTEKCGACHRVVSARLGAIGSGTAGPNLSGLFTGYYAGMFSNGGSWDEQRLRRWLQNPRAVSPVARMQPVTLSVSEFKELESIVSIHKRR